ncbi:NAD(P)H-dependent oxidoreductase [Galbibacter pacificus]|uniref:NAD(P)H-dependent oxidoreductase n=1 Tax=Galbibacter pacificus TaxID=2996052 RepID=A0ABT6FVP4_9FLAO|nr:NAD(P)H-dependent oxidoreductase [Galbibacter pacificus]MDG3583738.1 NAD(P)H-dependent oxidoreductase [Galbibacter pacificus]MDG3587344.1 NAD(P)H-dependent oxidoreductase [Galbibacter pacificus]
MSNYNKNLNWRYATKKFDATKKVSEDDLNILKEAIQLSASSYGLQPYKVLIISDPEVREKLKPAAWNQTQITDASHLIVFANINDFGENHINEYIKNVSDTRGLQPENLQAYADMMKNSVNSLSEDAKNAWTAKQTYIALGNLLSAAADLKIDTCPMEGFEPDKFTEILGLKELNLTPTVIAPIGYRSEEDETQHYKKVRKPEEELFIAL